MFAEEMGSDRSTFGQNLLNSVPRDDVQHIAVNATFRRDVDS